MSLPEFVCLADVAAGVTGLTLEQIAVGVGRGKIRTELRRGEVFVLLRDARAYKAELDFVSGSGGVK